MEYNDVTLKINGVSKTFVRKNQFPRFARVRHWHERYGVSYIAQRRIEENNPLLHMGAGGDPAVFQLNQSSTDRAVFLTPELERWMYSLLVESSQNTLSEVELKQAYRNMLQGDKAFTNKTGWSNGYQSIILNENIGAEQQRLQLTIANGATIKIIGDKIRRGGEDVYPFEVMDALNPSTLKRTLLDSWWLIFPATNSTIEPAPEGNVDPFPKLNDFDVVIPLLANGTITGYIQAEWVEFLPYQTNQPVYPYYRTWVSEAEWKQNRRLK